MSPIVSDTGPLNYLILIGHVEVLPQLFGTLLVPQAVVQEMRHPNAPVAVAAWARDLPSWIEVKSPQLELNVRLESGENEAIATIGTLAIVDLADEAGLLDFEAALQRLRTTNFYLDIAVAAALSERSRSRKPS